MPRKNTYMFKRLRDMTRNSSFSCFMAVFMSYCQLFWGSTAIYNDLKTQRRIESYAKKLVVFVFVDIFMSYDHGFWVRVGFARPVRPVKILIYMTKNS